MKILASDLDGTLVFRKDNKSYVKPSDKEAINKFQKDGNKFGCCTGRCYKLSTFGCEDIDFDFYITNSGAVIHDKDGNILFHRTIEKQLVKEILKEIHEGELIFNYNNNVYLINNLENMPFKEIRSIDEIPGDDLEGFSLIIPGKIVKIKEILNKVQSKYGNLINGFQNEDSIDFVAKGCSKGEGIKFISNYFKSNNINVIGDSYNDIPMFNSCNNSYTFITSDNSVKKQANNIVNSIHECINDIYLRNE